MSYFLQNGSQFRPINEVSFTKDLPVGTYSVRFNPHNHSLFLDRTDDFVIPNFIYGNSLSLAERILKTYSDRLSSGSTGVVLSGEKGSGKTLLVKLIANLSKLPVILVSDTFEGEDFINFIQSITTPCAVVFDEFEKNYEGDDSDILLTLLDGTLSTRHLFLLTCNSKSKVSKYMVNRPSRVYYWLDFDKLPEDVVISYVDKNLTDKSHKEAVIKVSKDYNLNFDCLKSLIEEMNRFNESPEQSLKYLNIDPQENFDGYKRYKVIDLKTETDNVVKLGDSSRNHIWFDPCEADTVTIYLEVNGKEDKVRYDREEARIENGIVVWKTKTVDGEVPVELKLRASNTWGGFFR